MVACRIAPLVVAAVMGMSVSFLVYIILGQYFGAYRLNQSLGREVFAIQGFEPGLANWAHYCLLPVLISVIVGMGYDTRYYRAVMVEESQRDYITTAQAKGATKRKVMFVHMLKNAMIPIITRIAISLPFLIMGSILLESFFGIPGMGRTLISAVRVEGLSGRPSVHRRVFSAVYIITIILTDVLVCRLRSEGAPVMMRRWLQLRSTRKFLANRLAVFALFVVGCYLALAIVDLRVWCDHARRHLRASWPEELAGPLSNSTARKTCGG